ncbi:hypothetical protein RS030_141 [Cryptosporidium xiaoi]|uniref:Phosphodiesterase n=1 Tax=Cryptosporidium xiaoi TaxID=659607 RepID=A0AAV9XYD6_9CRYT
MNNSLSCDNSNSVISPKTSNNIVDKRRKSVISSLYSSSPSYTSLNKSSVNSSKTSSICSINTGKNRIINNKNTSLLPYLFGENNSPELCSILELYELFENIKQIEKNGLNYHYNNNSMNVANINMNNNCNNIVGNGSQFYFQLTNSLSNTNNNSISNMYDSINPILYTPETINNDTSNHYLNTRRKLTPTSMNSSLSSNNIADDYYNDEYICEKKCSLIRKHLEKYLKSNLSGYELCKLINIYLSLLFQTPLSMVLFYDKFSDELIGSFPTKGTWNNYIPKNISNRWLDYKTTCKHNTHICEHNKCKLNYYNNNRDEINNMDIKFNNIYNKNDCLKLRNGNIINNRRATFPPQTIGNKIRYKSRIIDLTQNVELIENKRFIPESDVKRKDYESDEYDLLRFSMSTINCDNNKSFLKQIISQGQKQNFYYFNYTTNICDYIIKNNYNYNDNSNSSNSVNSEINYGNKYKNIRIIKDDKNDGVDNIFGLYFYNKLRDIEQLPCDIAISTQCSRCNNICRRTMHEHDFASNDDDNKFISNMNSDYIEEICKEDNVNCISNSCSIANENHKSDCKNVNSKLLSEYIENNSTNIGDYPVILVSPPSVNNENNNIQKCCICENNNNKSKSTSIRGSLTTRVLNSEFSDTDINIDTRVNLYQRYSNYKIPVITCPIFDVRSNSNKLIGIILCLQPQNPNILLLRNLILEIQSLICLFIECKKLNYSITQLYIYNELHRWVFKPLNSQKKYLLVDKCELSLSIDIISRICHYINLFTPVQYYLVYINKTNYYVCIYGPRKYIGYKISNNKSIISKLTKNRKVIVVNDFDNCDLFENINGDKNGRFRMINSAFIPIYIKNENVSIVLQLVNRLNINGYYLNYENDDSNINNHSNNIKNCFNNDRSVKTNETSSNNDSVSSLSMNSRITYSNKSSISSMFNISHTLNNCNVNIGLSGSNKYNTIENICFNNIESGMNFVDDNKYKIKNFTILDLHIYKTILKHLLNEFQQEILSLNMYLYYRTLRNTNGSGTYQSNHKLHKSIKNNFGIISLENNNQYQSDTSSICGCSNMLNIDNDSNFSNNNYYYHNGKCEYIHINDDSSPDIIIGKNRAKYRRQYNNNLGEYYDDYDTYSYNDDNNINKHSDIKSLDSYKKPKFNDSISSVSNTSISNNNNNTSDVSRNTSINICDSNNNLSEKTIIIHKLKKEIERYSTFEKKILDKRLNIYRELEFPLWVHNWNVHKRFLLDLFSYLGFTQKWNWSENNLSLLFDIIHDSYNKDVPYHNIFHALQVVQVCYIILRKFGVMLVLNDIQKFTLIFAALCHDIDHPGVNNFFLKECNSRLSIKYNDNSILENHHCNYVFKLLNYNIENTDIRNSFTKEENVEFRRLFIKSILSTDMSNHSKLLNILQEYISKNTSDNINNANINCSDYCNSNYVNNTFESDELDLAIFGENIDDNSIISIIDKELLVESLLHASDISNPLIPFEISKKWASLIQEEFKLQAELERQHNIPITPFMDVNDELGKIEAQIGFLEYAVIPQWKILSRIIPRGNMLLKQAEINREKWFEKSINCNIKNGTLFDFTLDKLKKSTISGNNVLEDKIISVSSDIKNKINYFKCEKYKLDTGNIRENSNNMRLSEYEHLNNKKLLLVSITEFVNEEYINII